MQSLSLPRPNSHPSTPFGRPTEPEFGLARLFSKFSPSRSEQQGYPSPPMSEPHSPAQRPARTVESERLQYPAPFSVPHRVEAGLPLPPPSSALFDPRQPLPSQSNPQQRSLYSGGHHPQHQAHHYQHGRPVEHTSYGATSTPRSYAYNYPPPPGASPYILGAQHTGGQAQSATITAPPPARPSKPARRTKAHVASACVNCKKAHLSCDVQRPCGRCVASGKQDTCKDVLHKKRGRPRLRDDRDFTRPDEGRQQPDRSLGSSLPVTDAFAHQAPHPASHPHPHRVVDSPHTSVAQRENSIPSVVASSIGGRTQQISSYGGMSAPSYAMGPDLAYQSLPVAFLNLDLVIQKSNQAFQDLVSFLGNVVGKHLGELLETRHAEGLQRLRNELRDERDEREPTYMAPITPIGHDPMRSVMDSVADRDVEHVSHGFTDRPIFLSYLLPNGQYQSLQTQIRLARTSLYFVTMVVRTAPSRPLGPPLLTQQLAPPAPIHALQSMSAPTPVPSRTGHYTPQQARPPSSASSAPNSPYSFNFSSVRTSLPSFSPTSYASSPTYGYSPTAGPEASYFPTYHPPQSAAHATPYASVPRTAPATSEPLHELNRSARLEGLQLPPIRTGPAPLGSPLHLATSHSTIDSDRERGRRRESSSSVDKRPDTPGEAGKRRRLNIHEVLE
ncbi:uncharacterized protein EKO05_0001515 [Ascochyta rabiei]|uniref:Sequence-specific DNA binding RNA polymerase II transcription factor n=1 Tax=Didymella rabiei TaxID=5454 RepID=A0A163CWL8_DIDRA|nr:uncharacterized protein EKO05_0001515 [Ascochyta rabiei]KZM22744.1 sequence-specific DNA binding RNA polymerase II transcription factor [Ascochyta rabiei]UPX10879.1 hypothetical protein EKO05_0001515 [Ascochyta rabiei]